LTDQSRPLAVIILAAGAGTRMKSNTPKMLHEAAGKPLVGHVVDAALPLGAQHTLLVIGHGAGQVRDALSDRDVTFVLQEEQLGTGHAVKVALAQLDGFEGDVMVLTGDAPLLTSETLQRLRDSHRSSGAGASLLVYDAPDPTGLGRIVRDEAGKLARIVEEKDATPEEKAITEINPGFFIFDSHLRGFLDRLSNDNAQGEYYLTEVPLFYLEAGLEVHTVQGLDETGQLVGVNNRVQLAQAEKLLRDRIRRHWLLEGVTMIAPETTWIDAQVQLGRDVILEPGVILKGNTIVGDGARIGAYSVLEDATVNEGEVLEPLTTNRDRIGA